MTPRPDTGSDQALLLAALSAGQGNRAGQGNQGGQGRRPHAGGRRATQPGRSLLYWLPVVLALGLFAQVCLLGLKPALAERVRLMRAQDELLERYDAEEREALELDRLLEAQSDPIYLERERRLLQSSGSDLLGR